MDFFSSDQNILWTNYQAKIEFLNDSNFKSIRVFTAKIINDRLNQSF